MSKAEDKAWEWASKNKLDPYSMGQAYAEGYRQAEKDFFVKAEKWLCEIHRVCDITDEHGYRIYVRELIGRFEEYIKQ